MFSFSRIPTTSSRWNPGKSENVSMSSPCMDGCGQTRGSNVRHSFSSHRMQIFNTSPTQPYKNPTESHSHSNLMHSSRWFWRGLSKPISHHSTQATSEVSETLGTFPRFDSNNGSTRGMEAKNTPKEWCAQVPQELVREVVEPARNEDNQTMIH